MRIYHLFLGGNCCKGRQLMCDCSRLVIHSTSLCQELRGPIVYCPRVSSHTGSIYTRTFANAISGWENTHKGVATRHNKRQKSGEKGDLLRREMMCSPWETPLCCTNTRRRFSVLGKSAERITRVKGKLPAHVAVFLLFTQWFSAVISSENDSSRSTRILQLLRGPDTLLEAGLCSSSGEVEAAAGG